MFQQIARGLFGEDRERGEYQCQNCGTSYARRRQVCPVCGGYRIERPEW